MAAILNHPEVLISSDLDDFSEDSETESSEETTSETSQEEDIMSCKELSIATPCEKLSVYKIASPVRRKEPMNLSSSVSWRLSTRGGLRIHEAKLLWQNTKHKHIWDSEFMADGKLVIIAGKHIKREAKVTTIVDKELHCLNTDGESSEVPFPGTYNDPCGVSICMNTGAIAVTDASPGEPSALVAILRYCVDKWMFKKHPVEQPAFRVALTDTDTAVCAVRWEKLVKYENNKPVWSRSITTTNDLVPYISIGHRGQIIVSTPATNRISVFSPDGLLLAVFPTWFIRKPAGVCVDNSGRVLVADQANSSVAQFTEQGYFVQTLVQTKHPPTSIAIYDDRYLAVGTHMEGLYLYELIWK